MNTILTADIGGTNSRFGLFGIDSDGELSLAESIWLRTSDAGSFPELIGNLSNSGFPFKPDSVDIVVLAVAGPVVDGVRSRLPLIALDIDISKAGKDFGFKKCLLINDFIAQAFACFSPIAEAAEKILPGFPAPDSATAVIGAGTGLGKAVIKSDGKVGFIALPSEGGHTNFPFVTAHEFQYQQFLLKERKDQYVTGNTVVSGMGLSYLHHFLTGRELEPSGVVEEFVLYPETLEWASRFYARVCRNYVLETLAMAGLYIAGGVAARTPELLRHPAFEKEFRNSDTLSGLLAKIPVSLIRDENSGLWGGAVFARQKLNESGL